MPLLALPTELLDRIVSFVNYAELASVRRARKRGEIRRRRNLLALRSTSRELSRLAAYYLFETAKVIVYPDHAILRGFYALARSHIAPLVRDCVFRADEALIKFTASQQNVALLEDASFSIHRLVNLEHVSMEFMPTPCCRASGPEWIVRRPKIAFRMIQDIPTEAFSNIFALTFRMLAEEFIDFSNVVGAQISLRRRLQHMDLTIDIMGEAIYQPVSLGNADRRIRMEYVEEKRYDDDSEFCKHLTKVLKTAYPLRTLRLAVPNSELISPYAMSNLLREVNLPKLEKLALAQMPAHVSALVVLLSKHEKTLRRVALHDIELRADKQPNSPPGSEQEPWITFAGYLEDKLPNLHCTMSVADPAGWRSPPSEAGLAKIPELEYRMLNRAREQEMTEADISQKWMYRPSEQVCAHCGKETPTYEVHYTPRRYPYE